MINKNALQIIILFVVIIAVSFILGKFFEENLPHGRNRLDSVNQPTSYNKGSSGTSALKDYLIERGYKVSRLLESFGNNYSPEEIAHLNSEKISTSGTVLIIEPELIPDKRDWQKIQNALSHGFNVICFSEKKFFYDNISNKGFSFNYQWKNKKTGSTTALTYDPENWSEKGKKFEISSSIRFRQTPPKYTIRLKDNFGILAVEKEYYPGKLVLVCASHFLNNLNIRDADNILLIDGLIKCYDKNHTVYFDEYFHGFQKRYNLSYFLFHHEYRDVIFYIAICFFIILLTYGKRFGQFRLPVSLDKKVEMSYYSDSIAKLLANRHNAKELLVQMIENYFKMQNIRHQAIPEQKKEKLNSLLQKRSVHPSDVSKAYHIIKEKV